ncbi:MAG: sulfite exporter TauE/SafE family protein [Armatimonadota bacterium]
MRGNHLQAIGAPPRNLRRITTAAEGVAGSGALLPDNGIAVDLMLVPLIMGLAAFVQGATGFGYGLVAMAVLASLLHIKAAVVILAPASFCLCTMLFLRLRSHVAWRDATPVAISVVIGVPAGAAFLVQADPDLLQAILGALLIVSAVYAMLPKLAERPWHPVFLGIPCGVLSGAMGGALGASGPPIIAFVSTQGYGRFRYTGTLQFVFGTMAFVRLVEFFRRGLFTQDLLLQSGLGVVCVLAGALLGVRVLTASPIGRSRASSRCAWSCSASAT